MPPPLSPIPAHPEKWIPKFNPKTGMLAEEHINNFMLSINLNGVTNEDAVVWIFPYTMQGIAGSWDFSLPSGSITSWEIFQSQFLTKFGDDRSTATLINDLSNLKAEAREPIKDFNLRFNKILYKIPAASQPSEEVRCEWYIMPLPSNFAIFVDRENKTTLFENLMEALAVEKRVVALEKGSAIEERKSKKISFKEDTKKKQTKDPFDLEGLQKVLKAMSNEMVDIKKQVAETSSKKPYRAFKRNPPIKVKPPSTVSNVEYEEEEEEENPTEGHTDDEEVVELQGMWDFILPQEKDQEAFPVSTRSKNQLDPPQAIQKQKSASPVTKDKVTTKKATARATQSSPVQSEQAPPSRTLIVSDEMEYKIIDDMKKTQANITLYELSKLKHQQKIMMKELHAMPTTPLRTSVASQNMGIPPTNAINKIGPNDIVLIGGISRSDTPSFLLTYEILNKNVHNCLVDSGASTNILPRSICAKLNVQPQKSAVRIVQLDRSQVEVIGELNQVTIRLSSNPKVCQVIDILVDDIPEFYGLILSRDWSEKIHRYFSTD